MTAALLFALAFSQDVPQLVRLFTQGSETESAAARQKLAALGVRAIPPLVEARPRAIRREALDDLLFDLKAAAAGPRGQPLFEKLRTFAVTVDMQNAPPAAVLDYFREIASLNLHLEQGAPIDLKDVTLIRKEVPFRKALDALCDAAGLDYDYRYGMILLARPARLWSAAPEEPEKPLTEAQANDARARIAELASDSPKTRDQAAAEIRKLGARALPLLQEAARGTDPEKVARARELIADLTPNAGRWKAIPGAAAWRSQKLEGKDFEIARKLDTSKLHLAFEATQAEDILEFLRDFSGLRIEWKAPKPRVEVTVQVRDLALGHCLEIVLLPQGLDLRISGGAIEIIERK